MKKIKCSKCHGVITDPDYIELEVCPACVLGEEEDVVGSDVDDVKEEEIDENDFDDPEDKEMSEVIEEEV
jgi:hypothetical protein